MSFKFNPLTGKLDLVETSNAAQRPHQFVDSEVVAGQTISALRAVVALADGRVVYADNNTSYEMARAFGITLSAANVNESLLVVTQGELQDVAFAAFTVNEDVFLGANGVLTQTPTSVGFHVVLGSYIGNNKIKVEIENPIIL